MLGFLVVSSVKWSQAGGLAPEPLCFLILIETDTWRKGIVTGALVFKGFTQTFCLVWFAMVKALDFTLSG